MTTRENVTDFLRGHAPCWSLGVNSTQTQALEELFTGSPSTFAGRRDALVKELRAAGQRDAAASVAERKKPTQAAYLLNQIARRHPHDVEKLADLGRDLARAQRSAYRSGGASDLRGVVEQQRRVVADLVSKSNALASELDVTISRHELYEAFVAAIGDPSTAAELEAGMLSTVPRASGELEAWSAPASGPRNVPPAAAPLVDENAGKRKALEKNERRLESARQRARETELREARRRAESELRASEADALAAEKEADALERAAEAATTKAERARADATVSRARAEQARRALESVTAGAIAGGGPAKRRPRSTES